MGEQPKKYHITDEGDVFRINDDGSFTSMGNAEKMSGIPKEDANSSTQPLYTSSETEQIKPYAKSNPHKRYIVYGILFLLLVTGVLIFVFLPFNNIPTSEAIVADKTTVSEFTEEIVSSGEDTSSQDIVMPATRDMTSKKTLTEVTTTKPNVQIVQESTPSQSQQQAEYPVKTESQTSNAINPDKVYYKVEVQAEFPGGDRARKQWLRDHISWPCDNNGIQLQGNVELEFIIERDGSISNVKVVYSENPELNSEALRLIKSMPNWSPAKVKNQPVRSPMGITLFF